MTTIIDCARAVTAKNLRAPARDAGTRLPDQATGGRLAVPDGREKSVSTKPIHRRLLRILPFLALLAGLPGVEAMDIHRFEHESGSRTYALYVPPSYTDGASAPLVVVLHGRSGSAARMAELTGFNARAEAHGFIVAYPEGLGGAWNYVHGVSGYREGPDDPGFVLGLIATLEERYNIDTNRVYAAGISNGGFMAQRLACHAPEKFAAVASVAAAGYGAMPRTCAGRRPVSMLYIHGTEDALVRWDGLRMKVNGIRQLVTMSVTDSVKFWSRRNRCGVEVESRRLPRKAGSPDTFVQFTSAKSCQSGAEVSLYAVIGGGHNWPGSRGVIPPSIAGRVTTDIHATDVIWSFFRRHRVGR